MGNYIPAFVIDWQDKVYTWLFHELHAFFSAHLPATENYLCPSVHSLSLVKSKRHRIGG